jgi:lipopolysaccharide biosynthesis glycosyltransferase
MAELKDHYIRSLEYAESKEEFDLKDLARDIGLTVLQRKQLALQIHYKQIFNHDASDYINNYESRPISLHFSVEDKFRLLNYVALQEARESSRSATWFAVAALTVQSSRSLSVHTCPTCN